MVTDRDIFHLEPSSKPNVARPESGLLLARRCSGEFFLFVAPNCRFCLLQMKTDLTAATQSTSGVACCEFPCVYFVAHRQRIVDATIGALTLEDAELRFGDVQQTAVLRRLVNLQSLGQPASFIRCKRFAERAGRMRAEVCRSPTRSSPRQDRIRSRSHATRVPSQVCAAFAPAKLSPTTQQPKS